MTTKWAERWVMLVESGRVVHILLAGIGYAVMGILVLLWLVQYCPLVLF
jgi:hypothetical protein